MEERVDINLTEGMSPSPPQPLSLDAALGNTNPPPPHPLTHFPSVRLARAAEPGQVDNSGKKKKKRVKVSTSALLPPRAESSSFARTESIKRGCLQNGAKYSCGG